MKKFGREDLPKVQRFEYNLADYDQNNDIQQEVEQLKNQAWLQSFMREKKERQEKRRSTKSKANKSY